MDLSVTQPKNIGTKADINILKSSKYQHFACLNGRQPGEWNRELKLATMRKLRQSMRTKGYMMERPIVVYWDSTLGKYVIVDGQHRFTIAAELELEFSYTVSCDKANAIERAKILNYASGNWGAADYVKCEASTGNKDYQLLQDMARNYKMTIPNTATLLSPQIQARTTEPIIAGTFKAINVAFAVRCCKILALLSEKYSLGSHRNSRQLVSAVSKMCLVKGFDEKRLYAKMDLGNYPRRHVSCADYLEQFDSIYNYKQPRDARLDLARLAQQEADNRNPTISKK